ncbi:hypothetical protein [Variovorax rhizosphaerae]|uniref:Uncharacterized protein n=1 Tax=Variovorax rhizosphaerae TaxID=1836200 RepID=A0ABU8WCI6_9BURK
MVGLGTSVLRKSFDDLVDDPEGSKTVAKYAVQKLGIPDAITGNAELNRWLTGNWKISEDSRPAPLNK